MPICKKCNCHFKNTIIIDGKKRNLKNRKFCLKCSPFGKHNTRDITKKTFISNKKQCNCCNEFKDFNEFYNYNKICAYCKSCFSKITRERQSKFKQDCLDYAGGKCIICGYNKCPAALEFHHRDPSSKKYSVVKMWTKGFKQEAKDEIDKCDLLCANCHRETHYYNLIGRRGIEPL
jgi:hypothetical protein